MEVVGALRAALILHVQSTPETCFLGDQSALVTKN